MSTYKIQEDYEETEDGIIEMSFLNMLLIMISVAVPVVLVVLFLIIPLSSKLYRFFKRRFDDEKRRVDAFYNPEKHKVNADKMC
jgi:peptidoglycan/LPS O-acetylase OafA/YrhL